MDDLAGAAPAVESDPDRRFAQPQGLEVAPCLRGEEIGGEDEQIGVTEVQVELVLADLAEIADQIIHFNVGVDQFQRMRRVPRLCGGRDRSS